MMAITVAINTAHSNNGVTGSIHLFDALLFDMDGTLVDSTAAIVKSWHKIGKELGVDPNVILATSHGRRTIDTLSLYDPSKANWEYVAQIEGRIPTDFGQDAKVIAGAHNILRACDDLGVPWAIVTSGTSAILHGWLEVLDLARPRTIVVAEEVERGKPDPAGYRLAQSQLNLSPEAKTLVLEDSPVGVRAGKAAGCKVVALLTTHAADQLVKSGADWIVSDLRSIILHGRDAETGRVRVELQEDEGARRRDMISSEA